MGMKEIVNLDNEPINVPVENMKDMARPKKESEVKPAAAFKPMTQWDGEEVEVTSDLYVEPVKDWDTLLDELGYDPALYEIVEPVKVSTWDAPVGEEVRRLWSYKVNVKVRKTVAYKDDDYKELIDLIKKHRKLGDVPSGEGTFIINLADWQMGKADGYGAEGTINAILRLIDELEARIRDLRKLGRNIGHIVIAGLGDMIENCEGNYPSQQFTVQLNRRQQIRIVRRLLVRLISRIAKLAAGISVYAVPGNHGENRKDGRAYTTVGDNDDVGVFEQVAEIFAANEEAYGHVNFYLPEDEIYMMHNLYDNEYIGFAHGHITSGGSDPRKKIHDWWEDQTFTGRDIGHARILVTAHYHHLSIIEYDNNKIHIQCPAMDGGSKWYENLTGVDSRPGTVTFLVDRSGKPYRDLEVL